MDSKRRKYMSDIRTATVLGLMTVTEDSLCTVAVLAPVTDQDMFGSAVNSAQPMNERTTRRNYHRFHYTKWHYDVVGKSARRTGH